MDEWIGGMEKLKDYAKVAGCSIIEATGRKGWSKVLGADHEHLILRIEV